MIETKEQFTERYEYHTCEKLGDRKIAMECTCEDGGGPTHWAAIRNTPEAIQEHLEHEQLLASMRTSNEGATTKTE